VLMLVQLMQQAIGAKRLPQQAWLNH